MVGKENGLTRPRKRGKLNKTKEDDTCRCPLGRKVTSPLSTTIRGGGGHTCEKKKPKTKRQVTREGAAKRGQKILGSSTTKKVDRNQIKGLNAKNSFAGDGGQTAL